jgi:uncharacterized protein YxjI
LSVAPPKKILEEHLEEHNVLYQVKQKIWSWSDSFKILDQSGNLVYLVNGKPFAWGANLSLQDTHGKELATITQKLLSFKPRYEIYKNGLLFAEVIKEFSWLNTRFTLDIPGPNDYEITGSFWEYEYEFIRKGRTVAQVSKSFWSWSDTFGINVISEEEDVISILCTVVVVDLVCHDNDN